MMIWYFYIWTQHEIQHETYLENDEEVVRLKNILLPVFPELGNVKLMKGNSSYTINKKKIYLCTEHNGDKYDDNMLTYVILHELAHTLCPEIGHDKKFQKIFQILLDRAERHSLFNSNLPRVENYCKN